MKNVIKMFSIILAFLLLCIPFSLQAASNVDLPELILGGDMDNDFDFDATDLVLLKRAILGVDTDFCFEAADVNEDGRVSIADLAELKIKIANLGDGEGSTSGGGEGSTSGGGEGSTSGGGEGSTSGGGEGSTGGSQVNPNPDAGDYFPGDW